MRDYTGGVEFSPARLEALEEQLSEIHKAKRKYGETVEGILGYADRIRSEIEQLAESESQLEELEATQSKLESEYFQLARQLSHKRHQDIEALSEQIEQELADLNMENTVFKVQLTTSEEEAGEKGIDRAEFLVSPNVGESPKPFSRIASGRRTLPDCFGSEVDCKPRGLSQDASLR